MGLMDMFSNMMNANPQNGQGGGILGGLSQLKDLRATIEERSSRPKPGKYCFKFCAINDDRCKACLEIQERFEHALYQLEQMEEMYELTSEQVQQIVAQKKVTKCTLCGAPLEKGVQECPYCGTAYPEGVLDFDIPLSKTDRNIQMMEQAQNAWNLFVEKEELLAEYRKTLPENKIMEGLTKFAGMMGISSSDLLKHNINEIKQGAAHYGVSLSQYIHGVASGHMETQKSLLIQEQRRIMEEQNQRRQAEFNRQQAQRQMMNSGSSPAMDFLARHAQYSTTQYNGGTSTSSCCGTCQYYLMHEKKCMYYAGTSGEYRSGPNDYCNRYRS